MTTPSDLELLTSARAGDRLALQALMERHQPRIYRFGMRMCGDPEDAMDLVQDTLLAVTRSWQDFRGESSVSTWLYSIARSFCIKKRRRGKFEPAHFESLDQGGGHSEDLADPQRLPDEQVAGAELQVALDRAIHGLEPKQREVLVLRDLEGLRAPEVARVLGITVDAVKSRLHRARVALRNRLAPLLIAEDEPRSDDCPDILTLFSQNEEGEIGPDLCREMERHLEACPRCTKRCDTIRETLRLCRSCPTPAVPSDVQDRLRKAIKNLMAS